MGGIDEIATTVSDVLLSIILQGIPFLIIILVFYLISLPFKFLAKQLYYRKRYHWYLLIQFLRVFLLAVGVVLGFRILGVTNAGIIVALGTFWFAFVYVASDAIKSLLSFVMINLGSKFKPGYWVGIKKWQGTVKNVSMFDTTLVMRNNSGKSARMYIPNSMFVDSIYIVNPRGTPVQWPMMPKSNDEKTESRT